MATKQLFSRLAALWIVVSSVPAAFAGTYYVSTAGRDSNPGTSTAPFRTLSYAYSLATPGTVIEVAPGTYTDYKAGWGLRLGLSGTASAPIVLHSQVRGQAIIDGQNASDRNEGLYIDGNYNVVDGFTITGGPRGGISIWGDNNQILRNEIHHNGNVASTSTQGQDGIYSSEETSGNVYLQNYIHDNGRTGSNLDHGFYLCGDNEKVVNNISIRNASNGLQIAGYTTVSNMKVYNNVFALNGTNGIVLWLSLNGIDIKNNIFYQNGHHAIGCVDAHGSGIVIDHNLSSGNVTGDFDLTNESDFSYDLGTMIQSDPRFVANGSDFHLSPGSPGIDAGIALADAPVDFANAPRPQGGGYDIGAYEAASVSSCADVARGVWSNTSFLSQSKSFRIEFDATPGESPMNGVMGLSMNAAADYTDLAAIVRFNPDGYIDARKGAKYAARRLIPYRAGVRYHFRLDVNVARHVSTAYVTPAGGVSTLIGTGYPFRVEQNRVASLKFLNVFDDTGTQSICGLKLTPRSSQSRDGFTTSWRSARRRP